MVVMGSWSWANVVSGSPVGTLNTVVPLGAPGLVVCVVILAYDEERLGEHTQGRCHEASLTWSRGLALAETWLPHDVSGQVPFPETTDLSLTQVLCCLSAFQWSHPRRDWSQELPRR